MLENPMRTFEATFQQKIALINKKLEELLPKAPLQIAIIEEAISYSLFAGGKRIRPLLLILTCELCGGASEKALPAACAVEFIHTYSLIHDDLPAMDNDDLRRGKPTSHKVFGEAIAILAGDALLTHAFSLLSIYDGEILKSLLILLANSAGIPGMLGGQVADMLAEKINQDENILLFIHKYKTAALITASVLMGAVIADASVEIQDKLKDFGYNLGLAFQVTDDILDVTGNEAELGKKVRKDQDSRKCTSPAVLGLEKSKVYTMNYTDKARKALNEVYSMMLDKTIMCHSCESRDPAKIKEAYCNLEHLTDFLLFRTN